MSDFNKDNPLALSWHDSNWIPHLNPSNILDYFSERSNPFYDRTCNNEIIKMQRADPEQMNHMQGKEYILLHCQEPILYVIRKQYRHTPSEVTPQADYYILAGYVYQAPDLNSVLNSRMLTTVHHLLSAFDEVYSFMRYHPTKGYSWDFGKDSQPDKSKDKEKDKSKEKPKEDAGSTFQRRRVDVLVAELAKRYPPKLPAAPVVDPKPVEETKTDTNTEIKQEPVTRDSVQGSTASAAPARSSEPPAKKARLS
ncbi:Mediator of RNA polymerase II transcription subunit 6 [Halotydeus destructor]|nr:Mediator of RNA polymerase II transcription subunit 6 [Halotydeus destructor]